MSASNNNVRMNSEEEEEDQYEVEAILDKKKVGAKWRYKIKWVGYPEEQCTWEPQENLDNVQEMLEEFEEEWNSRELTKKKGASLVKSTASFKESKVEDKKFAGKKITNQGEAKKRRQPDQDEEEDSSSKTRHDSYKDKEKPSKKVESLNLKSNSTGLDAIILADEDSDSSSKIVGNIEQDKPLRLVTAKFDAATKEVNCLVEWKPRESGIKPADTYISNKLLREHFPHLLLDFYESRLRFPSNTGNK